MIDFGIAIDVTQISDTPYFQEYRDKGGTPLSENTRVRNKQTDFVGNKTPAIQQTMDSTPAALDQCQFRPERTAEQTQLADDSAIVAARDSRVALLVQKYEGKPTRESNARLDILTERLRRLSPRVTEDDVIKLTAMVDQIEEISAGIDKLRDKFGIK